jgi:hypothetical protein
VEKLRSPADIAAEIVADFRKAAAGLTDPAPITVPGAVEVVELPAPREETRFDFPYEAS